MQAPGSVDSFACQPRRTIRREKNDDRRNFLRFAESRAERSRRCSRISRFTADKPAISVAFGINQTRRNDINPDVPRPQFLGQRHREGVHRTLGRRIERRVRHGILTRDRADIDDAASTGREMLQSFLDSEDLAQDISVKLAMEFFFCNGLQRLELVSSNKRFTSSALDTSA